MVYKFGRLVICQFLEPPNHKMCISSFAAPSPPGLFALACRVLRTSSPLEKVRLTREAAAAWARHGDLGVCEAPPQTPARPARPEIVPVSQVPRGRHRDHNTNVLVLHSLAHVELNAIDLSLDTLCRFASNTSDPAAFAGDFLSIAVDEARHFEMLDHRLRALGSSYGALPAHDVIGACARASLDCALRRVVLGQLVQEARGLDAGPKLAARLVGTGDNDSAAVVRVIADEEVRHVQLGVKWFLQLCAQSDKQPMAAFREIALAHANPGAFAPPFDVERRRKAGLLPEWYVPVSKEIQQQMRELRSRKIQHDGVRR